jgi:hypothetical protein
VAQCLVSFELVFPPSFFNIVMHLLVHRVKEISILGPVLLHNMFPFERFVEVLKKYVHNRARPEESISKGYLTEEVIEFCVDFVPDLKLIGLPQSRHEVRLSGKGMLGMKSAYCMDGHSLSKVHYTVLRNSMLVEPYMERHKNIVCSEVLGGVIIWDKKHIVFLGSAPRRPPPPPIPRNSPPPPPSPRNSSPLDDDRDNYQIPIPHQSLPQCQPPPPTHKS